MTYHDQFLEDSLTIAISWPWGGSNTIVLGLSISNLVYTFFADSADSKSIDFSVACCQTPN